MPYGSIDSQDAFQAKMDQILEGLEGVVSIADDIIVHGVTEEQHDKNMRSLMDHAHVNGLVFNPEKCSLKADSVMFFGCLYDRNGIRPDPAKVKAIQAMPAPTCLHELQEFIGMVTYLSKFIRGLSDLQEPLCALTKKDVQFEWTPSHEWQFNIIKNSISSTTTLHYFDTNKPVVLQVDASKIGLGATILQDDEPVAYASKALTETERRWANIEREAYALVFGCERFHTYVYGRHFTIESDHKPLEQIIHKNLVDTPARLQHMIMQLQPYDFILKYRPGKEMTLADALSRYYPQPAPEIPLDIAIHHTHLTMQHKTAFQNAIMADPELQALSQMIIDGWPEDTSEVPKCLRKYFTHASTLAVEDGLILKGEALLVPESERDRVLCQLHDGHQGITKTNLRAKNIVYWPGMTKDIEKMITSCTTCQRFQAKQCDTPLEKHPRPDHPWSVVASDLFDFDGGQYMVMADMYSNMFFVRKMPPSGATTAAVVSKMKEIFAEHGIPDVLRSDNGPQYASAAFQEFTRNWEFQHITSSPHHPASNGFAESYGKDSEDSPYQSQVQWR